MSKPHVISRNLQDGRILTLVAIVDYAEEVRRTIVSVGYSLKNPEDKNLPNKPELATSIALGRANKLGSETMIIALNCRRVSKVLVNALLVSLVEEMEMRLTDFIPITHYKAPNEIQQGKTEVVTPMVASPRANGVSSGVRSQKVLN